MDTWKDIEAEVRAAEFKYGAFASTQEALGVITEEYYELVEAIRKNRADAVIMEAIQIAAACIRLAEQSEKSGTFFTGRSGL